MKQYFGTDGIRGIPNETLNKNLVSKIFSSVELLLSPKSVAVILDTRSSSSELLDWICAGLRENVVVINFGVLPSGSMPVLLKEFNHDLGVIISASHNPCEYNGIKLIDHKGIINVGGPKKIIYDFAKKTNKKVVSISSKEILGKQFPRKQTMNIKKYLSIIK